MVLIGQSILPHHGTSSDYERSLIAKYDRTQIYRCLSCDLVFRSPCPSLEELTLLYGSLPGDRWVYSSDDRVAWKLSRTSLKKRFQSTSAVRVLDIGTFDGAYLTTLPVEWERCAVEPAHEAAKILAENGLTYLGPDARTIVDEHRESFDAITLFDVFEHWLHPREELAAILELLKPGGYLQISTGNTNHWSWTVLGVRHWYLHSIQHLVVGSRKYFQRVAETHGLHVVDVTAHSHTIGTVRDRATQTAAAIHFASRNRGKLRSAVARVIQSVPSLKELKHREHATYGAALSDHLLVTFQKQV